MEVESFAEKIESLDFPDGGNDNLLASSTIRSARVMVQQVVTDDDFIGSCLKLQLRQMKLRKLMPGLTPFLSLPRTGIGFALGHWAPFSGPGPHEHLSWTITGICRNRLDIRTFDRDLSFKTGQLIEEETVEAKEGMVGYTKSACIHAPRNPTPDWSLTFHMISPTDGFTPMHLQTIPELRSDNFGEFNNSTYSKILQNRSQFRIIFNIARILVTLPNSVPQDAWENCHTLGCAKTRRLLENARPFLKSNTFNVEPIYVHTDSTFPLRVKKQGSQIRLFAETKNGDETVLVAPLSAQRALEFIVEVDRFKPKEIPLADDVAGCDLICEVVEMFGAIERLQ